MPFQMYSRLFCHTQRERERQRENSCLCPNYFIAPMHEQTVYFWKLTACSVNSSLTSGMGTDNLPKTTRRENEIKLVFSPLPPQWRLFLFHSLLPSVCVWKQVWTETGAQDTLPEGLLWMEAARSWGHVRLLMVSVEEVSMVSLIAGIMQSSASSVTEVQFLPEPFFSLFYYFDPSFASHSKVGLLCHV